MTTNSSTSVGYALTLVVVTAFACCPSIVPLGLAAGCSPFGFLLAAMLVSLIGMTTLAMLRGVKMTPEVSETGSRIMLGTLFFLEHACLLFALTYLKVPVAMSLIYTYPFIIALVRVVKGSYAASPVLFVSLMLCFLGIALVVGFSPDQIDSTGVSIAIMQAGLAASRILLASRLAQGADGLALAVQMFGVGVILGGITSPLVSIVLPHTANAWFAIISAGLSSVVGHTCLMWALQRIGAVPFGVIMTLEPVVAAILVAVIAGQLLTPPQYAGALLVVASATMYSFAEKKNKIGV